MMIIFYTLLSLFLIITPFLYFLRIFKHMKKSWRYTLSILTLIAIITLLIEVIFQPTSSLWFVWNNIINFYILCSFCFFIWIGLYHLWCHIIHHKHHSFFIICLLLVSISITGLGYSSHFHKEITDYHVTIPKNTTLSSLKIAFISDIHIGSGTSPQQIKNLVDTLNQNQYDLICLGGDIFDENSPQDYIEQTLKILSAAHSKYGIYAVDGNHEKYISLSSQKLYQKYKITYLNEKFVCIDGLFNIIGREDVSLHSSTSIDTICENMDSSLPTIVLDHNPGRYKENQKYADIQLSGHTHAGQIFPGNVITNLLYDNDYGLLVQNHHSLIVSSGYGSWGFPIRFMTNCEYVEVYVSF